MFTFPAVLSGRDCIINAPNGSGKSLVFILQSILVSLQYEEALSLIYGEGPISLIITPSRELAS